MKSAKAIALRTPTWVLAGLAACSVAPRESSKSASESLAAAPTGCDRCVAEGPLAARSPWPKFRGNMRQTGASTLVPEVRPGDPIWSFPTGKGIFSSPVVGEDETIYIGSADRSFYALRADGTLRWSVATGEIIDSAALLDDRGRVYFGSGDGHLRAVDASTGAAVWDFAAEPPATYGAYINWFEGNVAIGRDGRLFVPNDNFAVYAIDRDRGTKLFHIPMNDQTWSLPAVDPNTGRLALGNNYIAPLAVVGWFYRNVFGADENGNLSWRKSVQASIAASPLLTGDRTIVGAFDGFVRALRADDGTVLWSQGTRDHVYASPALLPNGLIVQPSVDGTIYALDPATGAVRWAYDTGEPVRSSPAVDGLGRIYVGGGDGSLYVLNPDGTRRFSVRLVAGDRNDLNSSPALGARGIYLGSESGEVFRVPYDYCLTTVDARCVTDPNESLPADGADIGFVTPFGAAAAVPPARIDAAAALAFSLSVRKGGDTILALLDEGTLKVRLEPATAVAVQVSGDRRFFTVVPEKALPGSSLRLEIEGNYLVDPKRAGLAMSGGTVAGSFHRTFRFDVSHGDEAAPPLVVPTEAGAPSSAFELARLAAPLPTLLPSYNQIGFDSLHYLLGMVEGSADAGIGWVLGGRLEASGATVPDPATKALFPVSFTRNGGLVTLTNEDGFTVNALNFDVPFQRFRASARLPGGPAGGDAPTLFVETKCDDIPTYGSFLVQLGLCNPVTRMMPVFGSFELRPYAGGVVNAPAGVGVPTFRAERGFFGPTSVEISLAGSTLMAADHVLGVLLVDASTGAALPLRYGAKTTREVGLGGALESVRLVVDGNYRRTRVRAYLLVDTYPAAKAELMLP